MKNKWLKTLSLIVVFALFFSTMVYASDETNSKGVKFTAVLDKPVLPESTEDQTVTLKIETNKEILLDSMEYTVDCGSFTCAEPTNADLSGLTWNAQTKHVSWMALGADEAADELGTIQVTVPANTPAGTYNIGIREILLSSEAAYWEGNESAAPANALATLEISKDVSASYTAGITAPSTGEIGEKLAVSVNAGSSTAEHFSSSEVILTYDAAKLSYSSVTGPSSAIVDTATEGTIRIEDCGEEKEIKDGIYVVNFDVVKKGEASFTLSAAAFSDKVSAETKDLTPAVIETPTIKVTLNKTYSVSLPSKEWIEGNESVLEGESYVLSVKDYEYYNYTVSATMGGNAANVTDNKDGTYTVADVSGDLVFSVERTAKEYGITFTTSTGVTVPNGGMVPYGRDYSFEIPSEEHYSTSITSMKYDGGGNVEYSIAEGVVTIAGDKITDGITIVIDRVRTDASVEIDGSGASGAEGYTPYAQPGQDYVFTIQKDKLYDYVVTATVNGEEVPVIDEGAGQYRIEAKYVVLGDIAIKVERTLKTEGIVVSEYLKLDGTSIWLIKNTTEKLDSAVYTFSGSEMFWSDDYNAYCYLTIANEKPLVDSIRLGVKNGTATEIDGYDVNKSGKVDTNDAQLVYNMYNAMYSNFTTDVTVEKVLLADVNANGVVNTEDVAAIVHHILTEK